MTRNLLLTITFLLCLPTLSWAEQITDKGVERRYVAVSASLLGKGRVCGLDIEGIFTNKLRAAAGLSMSIEGAIVPLYLSWYPWGADGHSFYTDAGVSLQFSLGCCGGAENGGSDPSFAGVQPTAGIGYAYVGRSWMIKAGLDLVYMGEVGRKHFYTPLVPLPGLRVGYMF